MTHGGAWYLALAALLACGVPAGEKPVARNSVPEVPANDSLVLTSTAGPEVWFTLARTGTAADGRQCVERGLEIRHDGRRVQVPLLYTGSPPVLLNDSTVRAMLWTHCAPGHSYLVNLRSGYPVRERTEVTP